jgi:hypothetical protein
MWVESAEGAAVLVLVCCEIYPQMTPIYADENESVKSVDFRPASK